jgi:hypothetical protein
MVWIMGDEISEHSTNFCWVCFAGNMPASNIQYCTIYYGFKGMKSEQGLLIQQKKIMDAAGIEPMTSR